LGCRTIVVEGLRADIGVHHIIKTRLAPALFGVGLLEAVHDAGISEVFRPVGGKLRCTGLHFFSRQGTRSMDVWGWQASAVYRSAIRRHCVRARMGLTSNDARDDDCTPRRRICQTPRRTPRLEDSGNAQCVVALRAVRSRYRNRRRTGMSDSPGARAVPRRWARWAQCPTVSSGRCSVLRADGTGRMVRHCSLHRSQGFMTSAPEWRNDERDGGQGHSLWRHRARYGDWDIARRGRVSTSS